VFFQAAQFKSQTRFEFAKLYFMQLYTVYTVLVCLNSWYRIVSIICS